VDIEQEDFANNFCQKFLKKAALFHTILISVSLLQSSSQLSRQEKAGE
jgi:hypothetical protein